MKLTIFTILIIFISAQVPRPRCTRVSCLCIDSNTAMVIRPYCPNPQYNKCLLSVPCVRMNGGCQFLRNRRFYECQRYNKPPCVVGGCSGEICSEQSNDGEGMISICLWKPEFACYRSATCERQINGQCGWTQNSSLIRCLRHPPRDIEIIPPVEVEQPVCRITGCGDMCASSNIYTLWCPPSNTYACYANAQCTMQGNNECGFTQTPELQTCLANAGNPNQA